jgi:sugar phosphate isomerase/epimerase
MKLGFVSAILPDLSLEEVVQFAAETGYTCVELMCWPVSRAERRYAGVTHVDVTDFKTEHVSAIRELVARYEIEISGLGYYPNALSADPQESQRAIDQIRKMIGAAAMLGLAQVNTFIGRDWTRSVEENWPRLLEVWQPLVSFAEDQGVRIGIENCPMLFTADEWPGGKNLATSPAIWERMFNDIGSKNLGLNYDPSHMIWQQMDYLQPIRDFADRIFHVHAKDALLERQQLDQVGILAHPLDYHTPKLPGLGDVDWGQFFSVLGDVGYAGPVCVEVEDRDFEGSLESCQEALRQSARYLRQFLRG